jgi:hypothetical protein
MADVLEGPPPPSPMEHTYSHGGISNPKEQIAYVNMTRDTRVVLMVYASTGTQLEYYHDNNGEFWKIITSSYGKIVTTKKLLKPLDADKLLETHHF